MRLVRMDELSFHIESAEAGSFHSSLDWQPEQREQSYCLEDTQRCSVKISVGLSLQPITSGSAGALLDHPDAARVLQHVAHLGTVARRNHLPANPGVRARQSNPRGLDRTELGACLHP